MENWEDVYYAPVPDFAHNIVGCILLVLLVLGVTGNTSSLYLFATSVELQTPQNVLLCNLSVLDLIMVLACQPDFMYASFTRQYPTFGCQYFGTLSTFGGLGSMIAITMIAYDRYVMICFPTESLTVASFGRSFRLCVITWLYSAMFAVCPLLGFGRFMLNGFKTSCCFDYVSQTLNVRTFIVFMYLMGFVVPLGICIFCYVNIYDSLRRRTLVMFIRQIRGKAGSFEKSMKESMIDSVDMTQNDASPTHSRLQESNAPRTRREGSSSLAMRRLQKREVKIAKMSAVVIGMFLLAWTPYAVVALIGQFLGPHLINPYMSTIPALFAKSNCVYNPFIYAAAHPGYRKELLKRWNWLKQKLCA